MPTRGRPLSGRGGAGRGTLASAHASTLFCAHAFNGVFASDSAFVCYALYALYC